ncbi:MAG: aspartate/glutamate racemase family protein [Candidatus Aminicenantes bacterium]|nr:aspartate/glutamate racemase family protein [Candidatus Aminicenantes bacterium]
MKTIGLIGGMTWHSTADYYRFLNEDVHRRLGGAHSAAIAMYSVDFDEIENQQVAGNWDRLNVLMSEAALKVKAAGADLILICANTMHRTAEAVAKASGLPLVHIADAAAAEIKRLKLKTVGLLGTRYTMEMDFYKDRLAEKHGLKVLIPDDKQRTLVHDIIYHELAYGRILTESRAVYQEVIADLQKRGAEGIVLGCTEIPLLIKPADSPIPTFDTTELHCKAAVDAALA